MFLPNFALYFIASCGKRHTITISVKINPDLFRISTWVINAHYFSTFTVMDNYIMSISPLHAAACGASLYALKLVELNSITLGEINGCTS